MGHSSTANPEVVYRDRHQPLTKVDRQRHHE